MAENIFDFLIKSNYDQNISTKIINSPSSKTFYSILNFLIKTFDPNILNYHVMNEETIPILLKFLGYPLVISKSSFLAMTAPHTWQNFLHLLNWLVELLKTRSSMEFLKVKPNLASREKNDEELIEEMIKSSFCLSEKDRNEKRDELDKCLNQVLESLANNKKLIQNNIEEVRQATQTISETQPEIPEIEKNINSVLKDLKQKRDETSSLMQKNSQLRLEGDKKLEDIKRARAELDDLLEKIEESHKIVESQELSVEDLENIEKNSENLEKKKQSLSQNKIEKNKLLADAQKELMTLMSDIDQKFIEISHHINMNSEMSKKLQTFKVNFDFSFLEDEQKLKESFSDGTWKEIATNIMKFQLKKKTMPEQLQNLINDSKKLTEELHKDQREIQSDIQKNENKIMEIEMQTENLKKSKANTEKEYEILLEKQAKNNVEFIQARELFETKIKDLDNIQIEMERSTNIILEEIENERKLIEFSRNELECAISENEKEKHRDTQNFNNLKLTLQKKLKVLMNMVEDLKNVQQDN